MINTNTDELKSLLECEVYNYKYIKIRGIERDSRIINEDSLFAPIKGENFDAHNFIDDVIKRNVKITLWNKNIKPYPKEITLLLVDDILEALKKIARFYVKKISPIVIGITGSNGKTTIKDMCAEVLSKSNKVTKTFKNYNSELGLCLSIFNANEDDEYLVLEMGMDRPGDIKKLVEIVKLDAAIISNIGNAHIEFFKTKENIAKAKLEILDGLKSNGIFLMPNDDLLKKLVTIPYKTFGINNADIMASNIKMDIEKISFDTKIGNVVINSFGIVQVLNALPVIYLCNKLGVSEEDIKLGLKNVEFTERRNNVYKFKSNYIYDDTYKSNPDGLYKCFESMKEFNFKKYAVLSDMLELGEEEVNFHKEVAFKAKENGIYNLFLYGRLSKYTYIEAVKLGLNAKYYEDKFDIVRDIKKIEEGFILFKASNAMKINEVLERYKDEK